MFKQLLLLLVPVAALAQGGGGPYPTPSGNATNITGTVAITNGGTGATTASAARSNLGIDTNVYVLTNDSRTVYLSAAPGIIFTNVAGSTGLGIGFSSPNWIFQTTGGGSPFFFHKDAAGSSLSIDSFSFVHAKFAFTVDQGNSDAVTFSTRNTNTFAIAATGWTNTNAFNCTLILSNTATVTVTYSDGTNTIFSTSVPATAIPMTLPMHPSYKVTASGNLAGKVIVQ